MKQSAEKESVTTIEQPEPAVDMSRRMVINRIVGAACQGILLLIVCLLLCGFMATCCRWGLGDPIYGGYFPLTSLFTMFCVLSVLGISGFLANFRFALPQRFVREAITWMTLLYAAFALHCLADYLFFGDGMSFHASIREFCGRMWRFSSIIAIAPLLMFVFWFGHLFTGWLQKRAQDKMAKQDDQINTPRFIKVINEFIDRHPALIVTETREYLCLYARYAIWGALLSLLMFEVVIAFSFSAFSLMINARSRGSDTVVFLLFIMVLLMCGAHLLHLVRSDRKMKSQQKERCQHEI